MMKKLTYAEQIKRPEWQKKRLEILSRDGWECVGCGDKESTLHVHHKWYENNKNIWDYSGNALVTLCEMCHETEHETKEEYEKILIATIYGAGLLVEDFLSLAYTFSCMDSETIVKMARVSKRTARRMLAAVNQPGKK
jgi:hypothetical protein